jgi:hypothetical protein
MSIRNPLWGAPRIHGELLKPGYARIETKGSGISQGEANKSGGFATQFFPNAGNKGRFDMMNRPGFDGDSTV